MRWGMCLQVQILNNVPQKKNNNNNSIYTPIYTIYKIMVIVMILNPLCL